MIAFNEHGIADFDLRRALERHVAFVLDYCTVEGKLNVAWAAQELGVDQTTLWRWRCNGKAGLFGKFSMRRRKR